MQTVGGNQQAIKEANEQRVLNLLRLKGKLSRVVLKRESRLDGKSITNIVNRLMKKDLIKSAGFKLSTGGRPQELLELNRDYGYAIGIGLGATHIVGGLFDLSGELILKKEKVNQQLEVL